MSVDREYRIRISTINEGDPGKTADGLKDVGKAGEEAGEGIKIFETHGREMHKLMSVLDRALPGTGLLLRAAFNPTTLGIAAVVFGIEQITGAISAYSKKLDEAGAEAAKADFAAGIEAALEATRAAVAEQETYLHNLQEIEKGEHGIAVEMNNQLQLIAAIEAAKQAQAEADKTLAEAKLKEREIMGEISPSQAIIEKGRIEEQYVRDKRAAEERKFQEEQSARVQAASEAGNKQIELDKKQAETADALAKAKAKHDRDLKDQPDHEKIAQAEKEFESAQAKADEAKRRRDSVLYAEVQKGDKARAFETAQSEADAAMAKLHDLEAQVRQVNNESGKLTDLQIAAKDAADAATANATAEAQARNKANQAQREHDQTAGANAGADTSAIGASRSGVHVELAQRARELQKEFQSQGPQMSQRDAAELLSVIRQLGQAFFEQGQNSITKQQFKSELDGLRRLIESKGK